MIGLIELHKQSSLTPHTSSFVNFARIPSPEERERRRRTSMAVTGAAGIGTASYAITTPKIRDLKGDIDLQNQVKGAYKNLNLKQNKSMDKNIQSATKRLGRLKNIRRAGLATAGIVGTGAIANHMMNRRRRKFNQYTNTVLSFARTLGAKDKKPRKRKHYGVWFEGRRTAILPGPTESRAEAIEKARAKMKRGGNKARVRELTEQEIRTANTGRWVRTGYNHEKPGYEGMRGYGPKPKSYEE